MFKPGFMAAVAASAFLLASEAAASPSDEATTRFVEGIYSIPYDSIPASATARGRSGTFMLDNPGNLTAFVVGCEDACRGISVRMRAAGLPPLAAESALRSLRTAVVTIPESYRRSVSNLEVTITIDCPRERLCEHRWGALARGPSMSRIGTLNSNEWNGAGETIARSRLRWSQRPTAEDLQFFYPVEAWRENLAGSADLECLIISSGELRCRAARDTPQGRGFGDAAARLSTLLRVERTDAEGQSVLGRRVIVPIRFQPPS